MRKEFEILENGPLGRPDALQIFRFEIRAPSQNTRLRFRLVSAIDNEPSEITFDVALNTVR